MGISGSGKTTAALTFPNPIKAEFDNIIVPSQLLTTPIIPFYSKEFCETLGSKNTRDAFTKWLKLDAPKLESDQTLIIDSWTRLQDYFDQQTELEPVYSSTGKEDEFAFWGRKLDWSRDIMINLQSLKCHIVVTFHEQVERDPKTGALLSKIMPLMQGKFVNKIGSYFTEFYRSVTVKNDKGNMQHMWQVRKDNDVNVKSRYPFIKEIVPAHYDSIKQFLG